jgi:hypothetical protein
MMRASEEEDPVFLEFHIPAWSVEFMRYDMAFCHHAPPGNGQNADSEKRHCPSGEHSRHAL